MRLGRALPVDGLPRWRHEDVHCAPVRERGELPIDGGEAHSLAALAQLRMNVLGGTELCDLAEQIGDGLPLAGGSRRDRFRLHRVATLACRRDARRPTTIESANTTSAVST